MTIDNPGQTTTEKCDVPVDKLTDLLLDSVGTTIESLSTLLKLIDLFSVRHGVAVRAALTDLPTVFDAIIADVRIVTAKPETWDRNK